MLPAFRLLAKLKGLRGTTFNVFGYTEEHKLIADYEALVNKLLAALSAQNHALAIKLASTHLDPIWTQGGEWCSRNAQPAVSLAWRNL